MTIEWFGRTCVRLVTGEATVVVDPFAPSAGPKLPKLTPDLLLLTSEQTDRKAVAGEPLVVDGPGEFEVKRVFVYGLPTSDERGRELTLFRIEAEGMSLAHLGTLGHKLSNGELERLEGVDLLLLPVGGHGVLDAQRAAEVISAVEPRVVIPIEYRIPGVSQSLDTVSAFAKELGVKESETLSKFKVTSRDLPQDTMQVVILSP